MKLKLVILALGVFAIGFGTYAYKAYRFLERHPMAWSR